MTADFSKWSGKFKLISLGLLISSGICWIAGATDLSALNVGASAYVFAQAIEKKLLEQNIIT